MTQFCPNCGAQAPADYRFCRTCGAALSAGDSSQPQTSSAASQEPTRISPSPVQPPRKTESYAARKGLFAGGGLLLIAAVAAVVFVFLIGNGDEDLPIGQDTALMSPDLFATTQTDLFSALEDLNQAQLKTAEDLMAQDASLQQDIVNKDDESPTPAADLPPPEEVAQNVDENLREAAASAAQVADTAANLANTTRSYDGGSESAAQMAQQYDAIAQKALEQLLEIQNWREQYLRGVIDAQQVLINIASAGATFWNPAVTVPGVNGNPFVNILDPFGVSYTNAPVILSGTGVTTITTQAGGTPSIVVSTSSRTITRTVAVPLDPIPSFFNPYDPALTATIITAQGQIDFNLVRRWVLARLDRYRYPFPGTTTPVVVIDNFTYLNPTNGPATRIGGPVYVNRLLGAAPDVGGSLVIQLVSYEGIAIAGGASISTGSIPVFNGGRVITVTRTGNAPAISLINIGPSGTPTFVNRIDAVPLTRSAVSLQIDNLSATFINTQGTGILAQNIYDITLRINFSSLISNVVITCRGAGPVKIISNSGTVTISLQGYTASPGKDVPVLCTAAAYSYTYATAIDAYAFPFPDDAAARDAQLGQVDSALGQVFVNEYFGGFCGRDTQSSRETQGGRNTQGSRDWITAQDTQSVDWLTTRNTQGSRAWISAQDLPPSEPWIQGRDTQSSRSWITTRNMQDPTSCDPTRLAAASPAATSTPGVSSSTGTSPSVTSTLTPTSTAQSTPSKFDDLQAEPPSEPTTLADDLLGGSPNWDAAAGIIALLQSHGFDLTGIEIFVLPLTGTDQSLLILNVYEAQEPDIGDDPDPFLETLVGAPQIDEAAIKELALNYFGTDDDGDFHFVLSSPISLLRQVVAGSITAEAAYPQMEYQVLR